MLFFYHVISLHMSLCSIKCSVKKCLSLSLSVWGARWGMGRLHSNNLRMTKFSGMLLSLNHHKSEKGYMDVRLKSQTELHVEGKKFHFSMYFDEWASFSWEETKWMKGRIRETFLFSEPGQERATVNTERVSQELHQRKQLAYMQELLRRMILIPICPKQISLQPFSQQIVPPLLSKDLWFGC